MPLATAGHASLPINRLATQAPDDLRCLLAQGICEARAVVSKKLHHLPVGYLDPPKTPMDEALARPCSGASRSAATEPRIEGGARASEQTREARTWDDDHKAHRVAGLPRERLSRWALERALAIGLRHGARRQGA